MRGGAGVSLPLCAASHLLDMGVETTRSSQDGALLGFFHLGALRLVCAARRSLRCSLCCASTLRAHASHTLPAAASKAMAQRWQGWTRMFTLVQGPPATPGKTTQQQRRQQRQQQQQPRRQQLALPQAQQAQRSRMVAMPKQSLRKWPGPLPLQLQLRRLGSRVVP